MRLVDADAIVNAIEQMILSASRLLPNKRKKAIVILQCKLFRDAVKELPTEDAVPVKHGEWIREGGGYCRCSACNKEFEEDFLYYEKKKMAYCPFCGAKMDGGKENA